MSDILSTESHNVKKKIGGKIKSRGRPRHDMTPKTGLAKRIQFLVGDKKISSVARLFGMSPQVTRKYLTGDLMPNGEALQRFIKATDVNADWLMTGDGSPYEDMAAATAEAIQVPAVGRVSARESTTFYLDRNSPNLEIFPQIMYAKVHGNGLHPLVQDGQSLILTGARDPRNGDVVAIETDTKETYIRRYIADEREVVLMPLSQADSQALVRLDYASIKQCYVVVGVWFG